MDEKSTSNSVMAECCSVFPPSPGKPFTLPGQGQFMKVNTEHLFSEELLAWGMENRREFPWRCSEASLYEVFIAEFLLTQTPADAVAQVYPRFISRYGSIQDIERSHVDELADLIEPLGLQNRRSKALKQIAEQVNGELPPDPEELALLPRVGPYVGNATACIALNHQIPVVDTNVDRIYSRIFGSAWQDLEEQQNEFAASLLPNNQAMEYNLALLDFGGSVCTPRNPNCDECFAKSYCEFFDL